jgi:hypothetical protein
VLDLPTLGIDLLPEIPGATYQGDKDERQLEFGAGAGRFAGEDAEPTRITVHLRPYRDLRRGYGS